MKKPPKRQTKSKRRQPHAAARLDVSAPIQLKARAKPRRPAKKSTTPQPKRVATSAVIKTDKNPRAKSFASWIRPAKPEPLFQGIDRQALSLLALPFIVLFLAITFNQAMRWPLLLQDRFSQGMDVRWHAPDQLQPVGYADSLHSRAPHHRLAEVAKVGPVLPLTTVMSIGPEAAPRSIALAETPQSASTPVVEMLALDKAALPDAALVEVRHVVSEQPVRERARIAMAVANVLTNDWAGKLPIIPVMGGFLQSMNPVKGVSDVPFAMPRDIALSFVKESDADRGICDVAMSPALNKPKGVRSQLAFLSQPEFGIALARAAAEQTSDVVVYNDVYRSIAYPMGDVQAFYGVCTDVVVRAYRALGIDLQVLVKESRAGPGDASIDHRRTEILRRFFARSGASLPVSAYAEDYLPGDIVTYYRPQNYGSRSHIAIVADQMGPSGRPMIIHNRGWGVQIEDALFVDQITGHYRFNGVPVTQAAVSSQRQSARWRRLQKLARPSIVTRATIAGQELAPPLSDGRSDF